MRRVEAKVIDEMVRMYEEDGVSILYISNHFLVGYSTVFRHLHKREVKMRPAGGVVRITTKEEDKMVELYESGLSTFKVACRVMCNVKTVERHLKKRKVKMRARRGGRKRWME